MSVIVANIFPQKFDLSQSEIEKWQEAHPAWVPWVERLGLDHVYSTAWFAPLLFVFLLSLTISTVEQVKISKRKIFRGGAPPGGKNIRLNVSEEDLIPVIRRQGYFRISRNQEGVRFVKHPWGYCGNVLLHLGLLVVILSSLLIALTQKRGLLQLVEGEIYMPGASWVAEENGLLAGKFLLPEAVALDRVDAEFWETDDVRQLKTIISFGGLQRERNKKVVAVNDTVSYRGLKIYQSQTFGEAFFVEFMDRGGRKNGAILQMQKPSRKEKASYGNFQIQGMSYLLKAKYFADKEKKSINSADPLLILRLVDNEKVAGEVSLARGESGQLGPYTAKLVKISRWAGIIFVDITGMPGIFLGFFIIIVGGSFIYFMPPREFYLKKNDSHVSLTWKASKFEDFYREEFDELARAFGAQRT